MIDDSPITKLGTRPLPRPSHVVSELELLPDVLTVSASDTCEGGVKVSCATVNGNIAVQKVWDFDEATLGDLRAAVQLWLDCRSTPEALALHRCIVDEVKWHSSKEEDAHPFPVKEVCHGQLVKPTEVDAEWFTFDCKEIFGLDSTSDKCPQCYLPRKLNGISCFKKAMAFQLVSIDGLLLVGAKNVQLQALIPSVALEERIASVSSSLTGRSGRPVWKLPDAVTVTQPTMATEAQWNVYDSSPTTTASPEEQHHKQSCEVLDIKNAVHQEVSSVATCSGLYIASGSQQRCACGNYRSHCTVS